MALVGESFVNLGEESTDPIQRVVFTAAVSHRFVLHPTSGLIEFAVGQFHDMERVSDLGSVVSNTLRYGPDRSDVAHVIWEHHVSPRDASHTAGAAALQPSSSMRR